MSKQNNVGAGPVSARNKQKGITLIALIITIIVMLILVGVTVSVSLNGGLFSKAKEAGNDYETEAAREAGILNEPIEIDGKLYASYEDYINNNPIVEVEPVSEDTDCVGYYVDLGGEEGPEGVIYIDIANTETEVEGEFKEYYISSEEDYEGAFGTAPVLSLVPGSTGTESRFYVMALEDCKKTIDGTEYTTFYWYYNAYTNGISDYKTLTGREVGTGKTNTSTMLAEWSAEEPKYGAKDARDMWGLVEDEWYIPSTRRMECFCCSIWYYI